MHACVYHICMHVGFTYAWNVSKTEFNTKILLSSWIMHRFERFSMFWKAECLHFHLETTFPHCFVFVRSKTWHLWKVCLIYWTNTGSSIPVLIKYLSQNNINIDIYRAMIVRKFKQHSRRILTKYHLNRVNIKIHACIQILIPPKPGVQTTYHGWV